MAYLYCQLHGKQKISTYSKMAWKRTGEYVKFARGKATHNFVCNHSQCQIKPGQQAVYMSRHNHSCYDQDEQLFLRSPTLLIIGEMSPPVPVHISSHTRLSRRKIA